MPGLKTNAVIMQSLSNPAKKVENERRVEFNPL